jgi:hypothetical protein
MAAAAAARFGGMSNAERIVRELDSHLDHEVRLVLYGRAAIALGFVQPPEKAKLSLDVDAIIPMSEVELFRSDEGFWDAQEATNRSLEKEGLYITHLFEAKDVILRPDWQSHLVPITVSGLRWLKLFRLATTDLILTKMMRGDDREDMADIQFLLSQEQLTASQLESAFQCATFPELPEYREAFERAKPTVRKLAELRKGES